MTKKEELDIACKNHIVEAKACQDIAEMYSNLAEGALKAADDCTAKARKYLDLSQKHTLEAMKLQFTMSMEEA